MAVTVAVAVEVRSGGSAGHGLVILLLVLLVHVAAVVAGAATVAIGVRQPGGRPHLPRLPASAAATAGTRHVGQPTKANKPPLDCDEEC